MLFLLHRMEAMNPAWAILGAKPMELWRVMCSSIGLYLNSPNKSRYIAVSWEPRLRPEFARCILLAMPSNGGIEPWASYFGGKSDGAIAVYV
jgi:hypothetical protein